MPLTGELARIDDELRLSLFRSILWRFAGEVNQWPSS